MIPSPPEPPAPDGKEPIGAAFPIVGIGASAGGLDALTRLFGTLPPDTGLGFVLVQHLAPDHASLLPEILSRYTPMPVLQAADGTRVEPDHVYVIPPGASLTLERGLLHLAARGPEGLHLPVDRFLQSLAEEQKRFAIAVILSGTGSDGSQGILAIKEECGIVLAQQESSAQYGGMPHSAVQTGAVDYVLPPEEIGRQLARISRSAFVVSGRDPSEPEVLPENDAALQKIYLLLERVTRVDFALYKQTTMRRRIGRRMLVRECATVSEYLAYVQKQPEELQELYRDILISVTSFFRDPASYEALAAQLVTRIRDGGPGANLRIWVPGCATGEEVYSLAIVLREIIEQEGIHSTLQLFGTDLSEPALQFARSAIYPDRIAENVSLERLQLFFHKVEGGYQVSKALRDCCLFAKQDLTRDPPFSRTDLISCRNVLIYLSSALQRIVFPIFHYSLKPNGLLFLGSAETLVDAADLFQPLDPVNKIFERRSTPVRLGTSFPLPISVEPMLPVPRPRRPANGSDLQRRADRAIQNRYAPDGVLVNADLDIIQFRGQTGFYLDPTPGEATHNLLRMAHESLQPALKRLTMRAAERDSAVRQEGIRVEHRGEVRDVTLEVIPIAGESSRDRYFLIVFEPLQTTQETAPKSEREPESDAAANLRLRQELAEVRDYLRAEIQDHEAALEELRAANEEVSSANEELQSANEQLATAKEELQSANEELTTVNDELKGRNDELALLSNDLLNLLTSVNIPILMIDRSTRLRRFTPAAARTFGFSAIDIGRPLADLRRQCPWPELAELADAAINRLEVSQKDLEDTQGCWWALTVRPYRTSDHRIEGAVLTFADIDALRRNLTAVQESRDFSDAIVSTVREPLLVLTPDFRVRRANPAFFRTFLTSPADTEDRPLWELGDRQWDVPALRHALEEVLPQETEFTNLDVEGTFPRIGRRSMRLNARRIISTNGTARSILLAIEDVTVQREAEASLLRSNADLERFAHVVSHDLQEPLRSIGLFTELLRRRQKRHSNDEDEALMQYVLSGVSRMNQLITDLLAYSRVRSSSVETRETVDAQAALQDALWNLQAAIVTSEASVSQDELPTLHYNRVQLTQLFQNLVGNSLRYKREGVPLRIYISAVQQEAEWKFLVRDNGLGFDPSDAERIFGIFTRLEGHHVPGTGIGLAICKRIVEQHGGRIWAESEAGVGSTFYFTVPKAS